MNYLDDFILDDMVNDIEETIGDNDELLFAFQELMEYIRDNYRRIEYEQ